MDERLSSLSLGCISKPRQTVPFASNSLPPCQLISPSSCLGSFISLLERSHISSLGHSPSFPPGTKVHSLCIPTVSFSSLLQGSYSLQGDLLLRWFSFMCLTCPSLQAIFQFPIIFILLYIFLTLLHRMWDLHPPGRDWAFAPCIHSVASSTESVDFHWTTREAPSLDIVSRSVSHCVSSAVKLIYWFFNL